MRLWAITPGDDRDLRPWLRALAQAGLQTLLVREKQRTAREVAALLEVAAQCIPEVRLHADCAGAAQASAALPLHLSSRADPSRWPGRSLSQSCHSLMEVRVALDAGVTTCLLSPVFPPTSKSEDRRETLGVEGFLAGTRGLPVLALGGITPARARQLRMAAGVAMLGDLFGQPDPPSAAARLRQYGPLLDGAQSQS